MNAVNPGVRLRSSINKVCVRKVYKVAKNIVYSHVNLKLSYNCVYTKEELLDFLTHITITNDFATNGSETYRLFRDKVPSADTLLYHLRKLSVEEILTQFDIILDNLLAEAKRMGEFKNPVDIAIDTHDWLYYGKWGKYVTGTKPRNGTHKAYKFITICIVENKKRFHIKALPIEKYEDKYRVFEELLKHAMNRVKIKIAYLDRGFYDVEYVGILKKLGLKFIIQARKSHAIKRIINENPDKNVIVVRNYQMQSGKKQSRREIVNLFITPSKVKNDKDCFITNLPVDEESAIYYAELFRRRWGIETSYRVSKNFKAKTTSRNISIRLFYLLFSLSLYNLWVLINLMICLILNIDVKKPIVTAKVFATLLNPTSLMMYSLYNIG